MRASARWLVIRNYQSSEVQVRTELSDFGGWLEPMLRRSYRFLAFLFFVGGLVYFGLKAYRENIVALQKSKGTQDR